MPFVVKLPDGRFRLYYTDQTGEPPAPGARAIKSAISDDGLNFVIEAGDRLTYTGISYESSGIRGSKILPLSDGSYRMYYHGIAGDSHWRVLSAVSQDGLSWTRESGVRLDPSDLCDAITRIGNVAPFITSDGVFHLYVSALVCGGSDFTNGIFDCTSTDGLTFTAGSTAVVESYGLQSEGTEVTPEDPAVIMTDNGLRMYFAPYGTMGSVISESGIYSIIKEALPSVMITSDKTSYTTGDTMRLGLDVTNPLESVQHVNLKVYLEMLEGGTFSLLDTTVTLPAGLDYSDSNFKAFTLPGIPDDPYTWHAQLSNPVTGELISEDTAEWEFVSTETSTETVDIKGVLDQAAVVIDFGE